MYMCSSFTKYFDEVELWTGKSHNTPEMKNINDIFEYYKVRKTFLIKKFFQFDSIILRSISEFLWANLKGFIFSVNVCLHLIKYRKNPEVCIYTRIWHVLYVFLFFKKIGLINNKIFYEGHKFSKFIVKILLKVDGVIAINQYLNSLYKEQGMRCVLTAHDGVNLHEYENIGKYKFTPTKDEFLILYTGSLSSWKGVKTLVDCVKHLPSCFKLVFIGGSDPYLNEFKSYVKKSLNSNRIKIIPHIPKIELLEYIEYADILVLPNSGKDKMSLFTSPIKLFEYMASQRPIVASNLSSITEILSNNNSFLFEPDNPIDLADKIQKVVYCDCEKVVNQAYEDVKSYTWEKRAYNIKEFIQSITGKEI
jgi:glycosyltransferase involved in cell wall biosynthesis